MHVLDGMYQGFYLTTSGTPGNPITFQFGKVDRDAAGKVTGVYVRRVGQRPVLLVGALLRWELEKIRRVASETATP